jgi:tetratricopeptide (TPR) repeat protein
VIERLGALIDEQMTRGPRQALALADLAVDLAEAIDPAGYPAITLGQTRAQAWKDRGKVLSYLARHDEAIDAFAEAERQIARFPTLEHNRAIIQLNLAITCQESGRYVDAITLLVHCKTVFRDHGDEDLFVLSAFYEGVVLQRQHRYREARETYLLLVTSSANITKRTLAALYQTIGVCSLELHEFEVADTHLKKAIALHTELGQPLDAVKGDHARGLLLLRSGLLPDGIIHLRAVRHQYLKACLAEEAGLCGLEMVGAMLALGQAETAEALGRTIMNEFLAASLNTRAITAVSYLSEAIAGRRASPELATRVQEYVLSLRTEPEREFIEPPPLMAGD